MVTRFKKHCWTIVLSSSMQSAFALDMSIERLPMSNGILFLWNKLQ